MNRYKTIAKGIDPDEVLKEVGVQNRIKYNHDGREYSIKLKSLRLKTFKNNKKCVCCGIEGNEIRLEKADDQETPHFNLYHKGEDGKLLLMTKDHIIPKSKGGKEHISNFQTMCEVCNSLKSHKELTVEKLKLERGCSEDTPIDSMGNWMPIIDAPVGKRIMLTRYPYNGKQMPIAFGWKKRKSSHIWRGWGRKDSVGFSPTHFMEIPEFKVK